MLKTTAARSVMHNPRLTPADELLHEAEAQRALAELFPHLQLHALRAIQDLFPLRAQLHSAGSAQHGQHRH
jgi:hypothetical protein